MGCGTSKPEVKHETPVPRPGPEDLSAHSNHSHKQQNSVKFPEKDAVETSSNLDEDGTARSQSGSSTPVVGSKNKRRQGSKHSLRSIPADDVAESEVVDAGPVRDHTGLKVVHVENERLTHIVTLASTIIKAPICFVVLSEPEQMVLAKAVGLEDDDEGWLPVVSAWILNLPPGLLCIEDLGADDRTKGLPWVVDEPDIQFFCGTHILSTTGERLGTLCVIDFKPRPGMGIMCNSLPNLGEMVAREVQAVEQALSPEEMLFRAMDTYWDACLFVDTNTDRWKLKYVNDAFVKLTDLQKKKVIGTNLWDMIELQGFTAPPQSWEGIVAQARKHELHDVGTFAFTIGRQARLPTRGSRPALYKINMRPCAQIHIDNYSLPLTLEEARGLYFGIISTVKLGSSGPVSGAEFDDGMVPFTGVEMGPIIGKGSFGSVFKATWSGRVVAIKVIPFNEIAKVDAKGDPLEASLMLDLKHPNIVETFQHKLQSSPEIMSQFYVQKPDDEMNAVAVKHGSTGSSTSGAATLMHFWLMLEYCDVGTLSDGINMNLLHENLNGKSTGTLAIPKMTFILETLRDIARGMECLHSNDVLHSDLTAANILLDSTEAGVAGKRTFSAKVADFGLSRQAVASKVETNTYGTVTHMPPELLNEGIISKAADVYAYGVLAYEIYTKKPVWEGLRHPQIIHAIAVQKKHPELPPGAPTVFRELAHRCMAADPSERPTFTEIIHDLDKMLTQ